VAAAATANGLDLTGCSALTAGEALTEAKRRVIESSGMTVYSSYGTTDFGGIGMPCAQMTEGNCGHVMKHAIALVSRKQETAWTDTAVNSLYATSLLPQSARIFINAEIGDTGVIESATCDCLFSKLGFDLQVRDIAAISKVTAQGVTIEISELVPLLEEALPARFGGHPGDYQLCETEAGSQTELVLRISPGVSKASAEEILTHFLGEVKCVYGGSLSVVSWLHSSGIRAEVAPPILAATGKFRAVRLLGVSAARAEERKPVAAVHSRAKSASGF
jgi:phenylacetate-coenzyme A ligase PaaK-like adenylate-forming protein